MKKWNHYICPECNGVTVARHDHEGVTPYMLRCRAKSGCIGMARSSLFECSQDDDQKPHVIFHRPSAEDAAIEIYKEQNIMNRAWLSDHYRRGGSLMKIV